MGEQQARLLRLEIHKYSKSSKPVAYHFPGSGLGILLFDLTPDLTKIAGIRRVRQLKRSNFEPTQYQLELELFTLRQASEIKFQAKLHRILSREDTDILRWMNEPNLKSLPVSPHPEVTPEEMAWAGARSGTIGEGMSILVVGSGALAGAGYLSWTGSPVGYLVAVILGLMGLSAFNGLRNHEWRFAKKAEPTKLSELKIRKRELRETDERKTREALTAFEARLGDYSGWQTLSPREFEHAVARTLIGLGFSSTQVTQASKDGGVDVEAIDREGRRTIIQAKRYSKKVGVAVVRETIGVRSTRPDVDRAIVFSLAGFTSGARSLADQTDVELMDAKSMTLKV